MNAIQQKCRPKHQVLVLKCYPRTNKGAVDVKPNSSELSYLLFYATSRRSKIQKIGAFLEKKTASDVWRQRIGNVQVTLRILTALIEKAPKDLPLVAPNVLKILDLILGSKDITMVESSIPTFEAFCENHDASSSFADQAYLAQYESIVRTYASLASTRENPGKGASSKPVLMRWRNAGLEAIRSVSSSEALSTVTGRQFDVIVPVILDNLWWDDDELLDTLLSRIQMEEKVQAEKLRRRTSVATVETSDTGDANPIALTGTAHDVDRLAEEDVGVLAMQCLKQIFVAPNRPQIHSATGALIQFIEDRVANGNTVVKPDEKLGQDHGWAISMYSAIARWAPVQDRYVILVTAMDHLSKAPVKDDNLKLHLSLTAMIGSLLRSDVNLIGLSAMDVLLGLVQHMKKLIQLPGGFGRTEGEPEEVVSTLQGSGDVFAQRRELLERIQLCIGDLATHVYYADQISDMISTILLRLKPSKPSSTSSSPQAEASEQPSSDEMTASQPQLETYLSRNVGKTAALKAIKNILLVANPRAQMSGNLNLSRNKVPLQVWENTHWLLRDPDGEVRKAYADALLTWLDRETTAADWKARDESSQHHRSSLKNSRELQPANVAQRAASNASNREKPSRHRSHFLQLLHIAIYDNALQYVDYDPDIVLLHVLLTKLVSQLGVNAVQYGLPMVFRLQEDIPDAELPVQKVRLGSLCHGYFWAVTEKFDIENSAVGRAITNEVIRRRSKHFWTEGVAIPPPALELLGTPGVPKLQTKLPATEVESEALLPFDDRASFVESIAVSYADTSISPPSSPPQSPGRNFSHPILSTSISTTPASPGSELPTAFREHMLTDWSRDAAMLALQAGSKSESLAGSKSGTMGTNRHHLTVNGANGHGQTGESSPLGSQRNLRPNSSQVAGGLSPMSKLRKSSVRSGVSPSPSDSSRGVVTSIDQLKMVLTGQVPATPIGTSAGVRHDSDSDSMVSYDFTPSELSFNPATSQPENGDGASLGRQRSSSASRKGGPLNSNPLYEHNEDEDVPPVPPLPGHIGGLTSSVSIQDYAVKPAKRVLSSRGGDSLYQGSTRGDGNMSTVSGGGMDLHDLLNGIDSRAGELSLGNVTKPPY